MKERQRCKRGGMARTGYSAHGKGRKHEKELRNETNNNKTMKG